MGKGLTAVLENPKDAVGHAEFWGNFHQAVEKFEVTRATINCEKEARALAERQAGEALWAHQVSVLGPALARVADIEGYEKAGERYRISGDVFLEASGQLVERSAP